MAEVAYAPSLNGASFRRSAELSASWNGSLRGSRERGEAQSRRQRSKHREAGAGAGHEQQQGYASTSVHAKGPRKPPVPLNGVDDALLPPAPPKSKRAAAPGSPRRSSSHRMTAEEAEALQLERAAAETERLTRRVPLVASRVQRMYEDTDALAGRLEERMDSLVAGYAQLNDMAVSAPLDIAQFAGELSGVARDIASAGLGLTGVAGGYGLAVADATAKGSTAPGETGEQSDLKEFAEASSSSEKAPWSKSKAKATKKGGDDGGGDDPSNFEASWDPERVRHNLFALHEEHVELARNADLRGGRAAGIYGGGGGGGVAGKAGKGAHATTSEVGLPGGIPLAGSALYNAGMAARHRSHKPSSFVAGSRASSSRAGPGGIGGIGGIAAAAHPHRGAAQVARGRLRDTARLHPRVRRRRVP